MNVSKGDRSPSQLFSSEISSGLRSTDPLLVTWLNHHSVFETRRADLSRFDRVGIDGTLLQLILNGIGLAPARTSADSVVPLLLDEMPNEYSVALVGGRLGVASDAASRLGVRQNFVCVDGYGGLAAERRAGWRSVREADLVLLGLGPGLQDAVALELREAFSHLTILTVGGYLDQAALSSQYFPPVVHRLRLGWLLRLVREPRRLAGRYSIGALRAIFLGGRLRRDLSLSLVLRSQDWALVGRKSGQFR